MPADISAPHVNLPPPPPFFTLPSAFFPLPLQGF